MTAARDGKRRRADALRNRAKVLEAAEVVFDTRGVSASTGEVARAAGVGIGTVFRHFPTKEALLEAVYLARLGKLASEAEALFFGANPGEAFFAFFTRVVGYAATKNALLAALMAAGVDMSETAAETSTETSTETTAETGQDLKHALAALLRRAQEAGAVRRDIGPAEVMTLLVAASLAAERAGSDHDLRERAVSVILDGLRAGC